MMFLSVTKKMMVNGQAGKGSKYRIVNQKKFDEGWKKAFNKLKVKKNKKRKIR